MCLNPIGQSVCICYYLLNLMNEQNIIQSISFTIFIQTIPSTHLIWFDFMIDASSSSLLLLIDGDIDINNDLNRYHDYCDTNGIDHGECDGRYTVLIDENPTVR